MRPEGPELNSRVGSGIHGAGVEFGNQGAAAAPGALGEVLRCG